LMSYKHDTDDLLVNLKIYIVYLYGHNYTRNDL